MYFDAFDASLDLYIDPILNDTTMESGTHIAGRYRPDYRDSVEELIKIDPRLLEAMLSYLFSLGNLGMKRVALLVEEICIKPLPGPRRI